MPTDKENKAFSRDAQYPDAREAQRKNDERFNTAMGRSSIFAEVMNERGRQLSLVASGKHAWSMCNPDISQARKLVVLAEEFGEVSKEVCEHMNLHDMARHEILDATQEKQIALIANIRKELIQIAAVAVGWIEALDKGK